MKAGLVSDNFEIRSFKSRRKEKHKMTIDTAELVKNQHKAALKRFQEQREKQKEKELVAAAKETFVNHDKANIIEEASVESDGSVDWVTMRSKRRKLKVNFNADVSRSQSMVSSRRSLELKRDSIASRAGLMNNYIDQLESELDVEDEAFRDPN